MQANFLNSCIALFLARFSFLAFGQPSFHKDEKAKYFGKFSKNKVTDYFTEQNLEGWAYTDKGLGSGLSNWDKTLSSNTVFVLRNYEWNYWLTLAWSAWLEFLNVWWWCNNTTVLQRKLLFLKQKEQKFESSAQKSDWSFIILGQFWGKFRSYSSLKPRALRSICAVTKPLSKFSLELNNLYLTFPGTSYGLQLFFSKWLALS